MSYDERDEFRIGKAKRSKAGSLKPSISMPKSGRSRKDFKPEAVVKITAWAKSPASVKRMMEYIARSTGLPEEELTIEDLEAELKGKFDGKEISGEDRGKAEFASEIISLYREYTARTAEVNELRQEELKSLYGEGKPDPEVLRELHQKYEQKHQDNFGYTKVHIWNMREAHNVDLATARRFVNAFTEFEQRKEKISAASAELARDYKGNFWNASEDKRESIIARHRRNSDRLKTEIFEGVDQLDLPLDVLLERREAVAERKHPKARRGEILALEDDLGIQYKSAFEIQMLYDSWAKDFERKKKGVQAPRHAVHIALSAKAELTEKNVDRVKRAARATARKHFGNKGFEFVLGVHQDGAYPHAHLVVKCKNRETGKKLDIRKNDIQQIRKTYARELTARGLDHVATRPKDRPREKQSKSKERPSNWKDNAQGVLRSTKALIKNMEKEEKTFRRKLTRKRPIVDAFRHRDTQAKSLATQRTKIEGIEKNEEKITRLQVDLDKLAKIEKPDREQRKQSQALRKEIDQLTQADKDRLEAFNVLRQFRRKAEKEKNVDLETKATLNDLMEGIDSWEKDVERSQGGKTRQDQTPAQKKEEKEKRTELEQRGGKLMNRVDDFMAKLKKLEMPTEQKKGIFRSLREKSQGMKKTRSKIRGRSR